MNWEDELIEDCREDDGTLHPQTDHVLSGAHWMLRRLRTDEAVERVADGILASFAEVIEAQDRRLPPITDAQRRHAEKYARAAITALLGEDA